MEMEGSDWHSKRLPLVCGHPFHTLCTMMTAGRYRAKRKRGETKWGWVRWCARGKVMQEGEFHCHVFSKERGAFTLLEQPFQLDPDIHSWSPECRLHRCVACWCLHISFTFPGKTTGNRMLAELRYRAQTTGCFWNHLTPPFDIVQGERVIKGPPLYRYKGRHTHTHPHSQ